HHRRLDPVPARAQMKRLRVQSQCPIDMFAGPEQYRFFAHSFLERLLLWQAVAHIAWDQMIARAIFKPSPDVWHGRASRFPFSRDVQWRTADIRDAIAQC